LSSLIPPSFLRFNCSGCRPSSDWAAEQSFGSPSEPNEWARSILREQYWPSPQGSHSTASSTTNTQHASGFFLYTYPFRLVFSSLLSSLILHNYRTLIRRCLSPRGRISRLLLVASLLHSISSRPPLVPGPALVLTPLHHTLPMADGPPHPVPYNSHLAFTPPPSSNMDPAMDQPQAARQKRLKAGTACTNCRRKKLRCTGTPNCARCVTHNLECVVDEALFLKTNSPSSLYSRTPSRPSQSSSSSSSSSIHHGYPHQSYHRSSKSGNPMQYSTLNTIQLGGPMDRGSMSSSSYSGDEMVERNDNVDYISDRRMSASSATSFSSLSPSPSPAFSYNYTQSQNHYNSSSYQSSKKHSSKKSSYRSDSGVGHLDSHPSSSSSSSRPFSSSSYPAAMDAGSPMSQSSSGMSKKRVSKDQDTVKAKHKRRDSRPSRDSDPGSPSPLLSPQDSSSIDGSMTSSTAKGDDFKSVVSTLSLDGHGQQ
jgi:hypothetical protein